MEYEAKLNSFFPGSKVSATCQYMEQQLRPELLAEALHTHPLVIFDGISYENEYFSPSIEIDKLHKLPPHSYALIKEDIMEGS